jgi:hypothetical protein
MLENILVYIIAGVQEPSLAEFIAVWRRWEDNIKMCLK